MLFRTPRVYTSGEKVTLIQNSLPTYKKTQYKLFYNKYK